jgi:hypothetical protein
MREEPLCPLCGARSTWVRFRDRTHDERPDLRRRFPAECSSCRNEDRIHWKRWWQGIDVSTYGGTYISASGNGKLQQHVGERIARVPGSLPGTRVR